MAQVVNIPLPIPGSEFTLGQVPRKRFSKEKIVQDWIHDNIDTFMGDVFKEKVVLCKREHFKSMNGFHISAEQIIPKRDVIADFYVECESGKIYIIEVKNPNRKTQLRDAIGQLLTYGAEFEKATNLVLVGTDFDPSWLKVVKKYNLPMDFVLFGEHSIFLVKKDE